MTRPIRQAAGRLSTCVVDGSVLVGPRGLPYFWPMKHLTFLILCTALLFVGCAIEEVDENRETGTLYFRAENVDVAAMAISGQLDITGFGTHIFSDTMGYLAVTGLPVDSTLSLSFTPSDPDSWNLIGAQHRQFRLVTSTRSDTIRVYLAERTDSTLAVTVRTVDEMGGELTGMPLWLDGERWPEDSPATLQVRRGLAHEVEVRNENCSRGVASFTYNEEPTEDLVVELDFTVSVAEAGAEDASLVVNEVAVGGTNWDYLNPPDTDFFVSAWRPGYRPDPAYFNLDGFCGEDASFNWIANPEGYSTDQLFPDFTLPEVTAGQAEPVGNFSLRQLRGRVVLVTFWYLTCVNCRLEMPGFQTMVERYGDRGFHVVALDPYPDTADATDFPTYDFTFLDDNNAGQTPITALAGVGAFPTNFLILPDGRIQSVRGGMSESVLEELLLEWLPE